MNLVGLSVALIATGTVYGKKRGRGGIRAYTAYSAGKMTESFDGQVRHGSSAYMRYCDLYFSDYIFSQVTGDRIDATIF